MSLTPVDTRVTEAKEKYNGKWKKAKKMGRHYFHEYTTRVIHGGPEIVPSTTPQMTNSLLHLLILNTVYNYSLYASLSFLRYTLISSLLSKVLRARICPVTIKQQWS